MTAKKKHPIPPHISGRLGGLRTASKGSDYMSGIGYRGAMKNIEVNGADQPLRASLIRRGYDIASIAPSRKSSAGDSTGTKSQATG